MIMADDRGHRPPLARVLVKSNNNSKNAYIYIYIYIINQLMVMCNIKNSKNSSNSNNSNNSGFGNRGVRVT